MIPDFNLDGHLPPGLHNSTWAEFEMRFGWTLHRKKLLSGLKRALESLKAACCQKVFIDGSFVTSKEIPGDFDGCWDVTGVNPYKLDPILLNFDNGRLAQKAKYFGELFPDTLSERSSGKTFLDFFSIDKVTGNPKGVVVIDLRGL